MSTESMQTRGCSREESDSDYIGIPLAVIFGYVVGEDRGAPTGKYLEHFDG
jgi:hypothetical protein